MNVPIAPALAAEEVSLDLPSNSLILEESVDVLFPSYSLPVFSAALEKDELCEALDGM